MKGADYRALRKQKLNMTQADLATALGVQPNTVARREQEVLPISREAELALRLLVFKAVGSAKKEGRR